MERQASALRPGRSPPIFGLDWPERRFLPSSLLTALWEPIFMRVSPLGALAVALLMSGCAHNRNNYAYAPPYAPPVYPQPQQPAAQPVAYAAAPGAVQGQVMPAGGGMMAPGQSMGAPVMGAPVMGAPVMGAPVMGATAMACPPEMVMGEGHVVMGSSQMAVDGGGQTPPCPTAY